MTPTARPTNLELSQEEVRVLVQSLGHCIATCRTHAGAPDAPCEDCELARALKRKLEARLAP